jgi:hypothetical protein
VEPGKNLGYGSGHNFAAREAKKIYFNSKYRYYLEHDTLQKL